MRTTVAKKDYGKKLAIVGVQLEGLGNPGTDKVAALFPTIKDAFAAYKVEALDLRVSFKGSKEEGPSYQIEVSDVEGKIKYRNNLTQEGYSPEEIQKLKEANEKANQAHGQK